MLIFNWIKKYIAVNKFYAKDESLRQKIWATNKKLSNLLFKQKLIKPANTINLLIIKNTKLAGKNAILLKLYQWSNWSKN